MVVTHVAPAGDAEGAARRTRLQLKKQRNTEGKKKVPQRAPMKPAPDITAILAKIKKEKK